MEPSHTERRHQAGRGAHRTLAAAPHRARKRTPSPTGTGGRARWILTLLLVLLPAGAAPAWALSDHRAAPAAHRSVQSQVTVRTAAEPESPQRAQTRWGRSATPPPTTAPVASTTPAEAVPSDPTTIPSPAPTLDGQDPAPAAGVEPADGPAAGKSVAFVDDFDQLRVGKDGDPWAFTSNSYAFGDHNPADHKLDWNTPSAMSVTDGALTITATPRDSTYWNTGFLTTEPRSDMSHGGSGFRLQPGDFYVIRAKMPTGNSGAWPALWTWQPGFTRGGEMDPFEYHNDNPGLLELGNALGGKSLYWTDNDLVQPGKFVWIGILAGEQSNGFYVGSSLETMTKVWDDGFGLHGARPYLIANLSVSDGTWHPRPQGTAPISYTIDTVRVYR
jgi:hypothetical protein